MSADRRYQVVAGGIIGYALAYALGGLALWPMPLLDAHSGGWRLGLDPGPTEMMYPGQLALGLLGACIGSGVGWGLTRWGRARGQQASPLAVGWAVAAVSLTALLYLMGLRPWAY